MSRYRTDRYRQIAKQTEADYNSHAGDVRTGGWFQLYAPKWRNRVGMPRLIAESVTVDALGSFRSINRGIFRDRDERARYDRALSALEEFSVEFAAENWRRFEQPSRRRLTDHMDGSRDA
ncbi:hypothetical protein IC744_16270 [Microbacterium hominis]|uniref:hypothetical protein n=1 Tax=Microbacterium hominis TaxID=162426 RepID=UPI00168B48BB|nr:hypothetical protein [Microbacterium hominis]QOC24817.1 hypothetical protein IC745_10520 [Microbacterium hominis]QOC28870.1 hypothetical protein IC744_16270 [Microbacterium hominis]